MCERSVVLDHGRMIAEGSVDDGIQALRQSLAGDTLSGGARYGIGRPQFQEVVTPSTDVQPGGELDIVVRVASEVAVDDVVLGIEVRDARDRALLVTNTDALGCDLTIEPGVTTATFRIEPVPLLHGVYQTAFTLSFTATGASCSTGESWTASMSVNPAYTADQALPVRVELDWTPAVTHEAS